MTTPTNQTNTHKILPWDLEAKLAFQKDVLYSTLMLALLDLQRPFEIKTNVSQYAIGVVLKHEGHSMTYYSKTMSQGKLNYKTYNKEFYALVQALKRWRHDILGKETIIP